MNIILPYQIIYQKEYNLNTYDRLGILKRFLLLQCSRFKYLYSFHNGT